MLAHCMHDNSSSEWAMPTMTSLLSGLPKPSLPFVQECRKQNTGAANCSRAPQCFPRQAADTDICQFCAEFTLRLAALQCAVWRVWLSQQPRHLLDPGAEPGAILIYGSFYILMGSGLFE